jgi:hypothetical protein
MANVRDEQVFRQTLLSANAKARDQQVFRQTLLSANAKARDQQVFRQTLVLFGPAVSLYTMSFVAT